MHPRRDATAQVQDAMETTLPVPTQNAASLKTLFAAKGFTTQDLVALSGAHSLGVSHATVPRVSAVP